MPTADKPLDMASSGTLADSESQLSQGKTAETSPDAYKARYANPAQGPLGSAGFATTLMALSLSMLGCRDVSNSTVFIGNLCFIAGIGLLVSAQWEMVRGNTFGYTVLSSFGLYYAGYGVLLMPGMGIIDAYGGYTAEYYNAFGLYLLVWCILNSFFLLASLAINVPNIIIFAGLEFSYLFNCAAHFAMADGNTAASAALTRAAGAFGAVAAASGFYMVGYELCRDVFPFELPVGDTSRFFGRRKLC
ncbi:Acetate transporter protein patA like [Verticillium longisporum]|uniref:Acetate transporter protein patA like n=1 Tax=Verticillium longisporum TaxID=100787 RepID=A0A8I2Z7F1_VERLO|nr:Acetate transporter protein patA like [Verticillium longisporum]